MNAIENVRDAALPSRYLLTSDRAVSSSGATPVAMNTLTLSSGPALAVVVRDRRDHTVEIHRPDAETGVIPLEGVNRPPQSMVGRAMSQTARGF